MRAKGTTGWKESHRLINVDLREDLQGLFDVVRDTLDLMPLPLTLTFFLLQSQYYHYYYYYSLHYYCYCYYRQLLLFIFSFLLISRYSI